MAYTAAIPVNCAQNFSCVYTVDRVIFNVHNCIYTVEDMQFDWDDEKNGANLAKHGVSFELASYVFDDPYTLACLTRASTRSDGRPSGSRGIS